METIRNRLIYQGASVKRKDGIILIRLNQSFPYQSEVLDILKVLRLQVKVQQVQKVLLPKSIELH
jgi:hypothetical protein